MCPFLLKEADISLSSFSSFEFVKHYQEKNKKLERELDSLSSWNMGIFRELFLIIFSKRLEVR
jgi:hypothetical protein